MDHRANEVNPFHPLPAVPTVPTNPAVPTVPTNPAVPTVPTNPAVKTLPTNPAVPTVVTVSTNLAAAHRSNRHRLFIARRRPHVIRAADGEPVCRRHSPQPRVLQALGYRV